MCVFLLSPAPLVVSVVVCIALVEIVIASFSFYVFSFFYEIKISCSLIKVIKLCRDG